jgi:predicted ArsR family transcriptional regulator
MKRPKVAAPSLWDQLNALAGASQVPEGQGFTAREWAPRLGLSLRATRDRIAQLRAQGAIQEIGTRGRAKVYDLTKKEG